MEVARRATARRLTRPAAGLARLAHECAARRSTPLAAVRASPDRPARCLALRGRGRDSTAHATVAVVRAGGGRVVRARPGHCIAGAHRDAARDGATPAACRACRTADRAPRAALRKQPVSSETLQRMRHAAHMGAVIRRGVAATDAVDRRLHGAARRLAAGLSLFALRAREGRRGSQPHRRDQCETRSHALLPQIGRKQRACHRRSQAWAEARACACERGFATGPGALVAGAGESLGGLTRRECQTHAAAAQS